VQVWVSEGTWISIKNKLKRNQSSVQLTNIPVDLEPARQYVYFCLAVLPYLGECLGLHVWLLIKITRLSADPQWIAKVADKWILIKSLFVPLAYRPDSKILGGTSRRRQRTHKDRLYNSAAKQAGPQIPTRCCERYEVLPPDAPVCSRAWWRGNLHRLLTKTLEAPILVPRNHFQSNRYKVHLIRVIKNYIINRVLFL